MREVQRQLNCTETITTQLLICTVLYQQRPSISRRETRDFTQIFHASVTLCDWLRLGLARFAKM